MREIEKRAKTGRIAAVRAASGNAMAVPTPVAIRIPARIRSRPRRPRISPAKDGGYIRVIESPSDAGEEARKDRLLCVQTVLRLIEDDRLRPDHTFVRDFQTAMRSSSVIL